VRRQTLFLYEVDIDELAKLAPATVGVNEIRPGIGILAIECLNYHAGHFGEMTESVEMVVSVAVEPDLGIAMPLPKFSLYVANVISSSPAFVAHEREILRTPMALVPDLRMRFADDGAGVAVFDGETPIVACTNTRSPPVFEPKTAWGLIYADQGGAGALHQGVFRWEGEMFEHQQSGDHGRLLPHAVWKGLDLKRVRGCYRQMFARPDAATKIGYYHLGPARR
jgi:hypothetical protein